jgi:hypothetical protein
MSIEVAFYSKRHNLVSAINRSLGERIFEWFKIILQCIIPLYNIFVGLCFTVATFNQNFLEKTIHNCIFKGTIKYKDSEEEN